VDETARKPPVLASAPCHCSGDDAVETRPDLFHPRRACAPGVVEGAVGDDARPDRWPSVPVVKSPEGIVIDFGFCLLRL